MNELIAKHGKQLASFGIKVKHERRARKMTQMELASKVDVDVRTIQRIEKGARNVSFIIILALSEELSIEITEIFGKPH